MATDLYRRDVTAVTVSINAHNCPSCGVIYGLNDDHERRLLESNGGWYCTNGHPVIFQDSDLTVAERQLANMTADNSRLVNDLMDAAKEARRLKRRAKAGICSECKRTFQNVKRHMASQHPA